MGILRFCDWGYCQFDFKYHLNGSKWSLPIDVVFCRDASTPIRNISNLRVVCDETSMSQKDFVGYF